MSRDDSTPRPGWPTGCSRARVAEFEEDLEGMRAFTPLWPLWTKDGRFNCMEAGGG